MPLLLLLPRSSDNAFCKCFLPARRSSLQCHTIRALFFFSSQTRLLCPHLKSASKSVFASSKVTSMFFSCSLNQSLSQLSTRPGPRFTRCISVSNCDDYLSKGLDGPLHRVTLAHACVLLCVICVCMTCMSQRLCWGQRTTCKGWPSLPPSGGWGLNSDCSPWRQVSVPAEPSRVLNARVH